MYRSHFNLEKKPFQLSSDNSFLWLGKAHAGALELLKRGMDGPSRLLVLTGDIGTGKTTLLHELIESVSEKTALAHITDPSLELHYLFLAIAQGLGFGILYQEGEKFAPVLGAFLARKRQKGEKCLIIIDEAHLIPDRFLSLLLSWSKSAPDNTLTLILAGQLEFHTVLTKALGRDWKDQVDVHAMLSSLDENETRDYIHRRLELAGAKDRIFLPPAIRQVHQFSKGIPRRINIACDQSMIAAYAKDMHTVDVQTFQEAVGILKLPETPKPIIRPKPAGGVTAPSPQIAAQPRRPAKALAGLAAAIILASVAYTFYPQPVSAPIQIPPDRMEDPASTDESPHSKTAMLSETLMPPEQAVRDESPPPDPREIEEMPSIPPVMSGPSREHRTSPPHDLAATQPETRRPEEFQAEPYEPPEPEKRPSPPIAPPAAEADEPSNMDKFIKEVFMIKESSSISESPGAFPQTQAQKAPKPKHPEPEQVSAADESPGIPKPETAPPPPSQPDPDAIIDWLIRKKGR
ncbi:MAG: AAA family ATPase [Desulfobacter sp.]|nr:MAG: AAA family ATPase [Desulfobacter sp.]